MTPSPVRERRWRFLGLRRSGNHALIQWCLRQAGEGMVFSNNVSPFLRTPETSALTAEQLASAASVAVSLEDHALAVAGHPEVEAIQDRRFGTARDAVDILVIRDPFNLFASRLRHTGPTDRMDHVRSDLFGFEEFWVDYALEALGRRRRLRRSRVVVANYNRWCADAGYRRRLADELRVPFTDPGRDEVARFGGGSSFDGRQVPGSAMRTSDRWQHFRDDPAYRRRFRDPAVRALALELFDLDDETRAFAGSLAVSPAVGLWHRIKRWALDRFAPRLELWRHRGR